jgi:hypothetical protein
MGATSPMGIIPKPTDLQAGRNAGYNGGPAEPPPEIVDRSAYVRGYAEGRDEIEQEMHRWQRARIIHQRAIPPIRS